MLEPKRGIGTALAAGLIVVILGVSGGVVLYGAEQKSTTTETSTSTSTVIAPTVTSTATTTLPQSTITTTAPGPTTTVTTTSAGPTTTVTSLATETATITSSIVVTTTSTVTSGQTSSSTTTTAATTTSSSSSCTTTSSSTTTTTTASSNATIGLELVQLAQIFPKMSLTFGENTTNGPLLLNSSYVVDYAPAMGTATYKIAYVESVPGFSESTTAWILSNGTLLATESSGQNSTGYSAEYNLLVSGAPFLLIAGYSSSPSSLVPSSSIYPTSQSTVTLGSLILSVTNYRANSLPLILGSCSSTTILTTFILQAGIVPGTGGFTLLTYLDMQGTQQSSGASSPYSIYLKVTSVTVA